MLSRTKLILVAVVVLTAAIPATYACLTWAVEAPLSFRLVGHREPVAGPGLFGDTVYKIPFDIEVRNTSSVAIHLIDLAVTSRSHATIPTGMFSHRGVGFGVAATSGMSDPVIIKAHDAVRFTYTSPGSTPEVLTSIQPEMGSLHVTHTKYRLLEWLFLVRSWCPASLQNRFPVFDGQYDVAPLEIPNPLPASTSSDLKSQISNFKS
ncbi:hypothetical protein DES53_11579 [Roseimicrobium gellanilyticum]|uniref:Uncharacterized protein n=1 Tax=Roseimicrobium gellanilyticum TaxID=748857 RepID=A0A366H4V2_9BACT|nr:hypothetical protein [Roseimicrobium gellanilyticum]RBP36938.1 hypothetical protein DES53_11579 [Roseimicrobium gellanilyticum]